MLIRTLAASIVAAGVLAAAAPASAGSGSFSVRVEVGQPYHVGGQSYKGGRRYGAPKDHYQRTLSPQQVRRILRSKGYRGIRYVDRRGTIYQARVEDFRGRDYRLIVSARTGAILERQRLRG